MKRDFFVDPVGDIFLGLADEFGLLWLAFKDQAVE